MAETVRDITILDAPGSKKFLPRREISAEFAAVMVVPPCHLELVQYPTHGGLGLPAQTGPARGNPRSGKGPLRVRRYRGGGSTGLPVGLRHAARVSHLREADTPVRRVHPVHAARVIHPFRRVLHLSDAVRHHFMGVTDDAVKVMHHHREVTHHLDMVTAPIPEEMPPIAKENWSEWANWTLTGA